MTALENLKERLTSKNIKFDVDGTKMIIPIPHGTITVTANGSDLYVVRRTRYGDDTYPHMTAGAVVNLALGRLDSLSVLIDITDPQYSNDGPDI